MSETPVKEAPRDRLKEITDSTVVAPIESKN